MERFKDWIRPSLKLIDTEKLASHSIAEEEELINRMNENLVHRSQIRPSSREMLDEMRDKTEFEALRGEFVTSREKTVELMYKMVNLMDEVEDVARITHVRPE